MKRFLSILLTLTMLAGMFTFAFANELGTIVFYNAEDNSVVTQLDGVNNVYAKATFTAKGNTANVMAAHYDIETGALTKMESIDSVSTTAGVVANYTTSAISVSDTDLLKVFAWDAETIAPLTNAGMIARELLEELPTATVTAISTDADFALNFVADEVTDEQLAFYGDWKADFVFTANKAATFNADGTKDGYLVGQYDEFGPEFVKVPATDLTITAGTPVSIMDAAGLNVTFRDVVETVKDFDCGVDYADAYLKANNGLEVSIALVLVNPENGNTYTIAEKAFDFNMPTATVTEIEVADADFALNFKADVATESQVATFGDWKADFVFTTNKDATFNANGTKDGYLVGQYDEFGPEFVSIPAADYTVTAGVPVNVLETAGMNVTYRDVVETIKDFDCGVNFADSYLKANDGLEVSLALVIVNPVTGEAYTIAEKAFDFTMPTATVTDIKVAEADFALNFKADEATESQVATFGDWKADFVFTTNKDATFNANGTKDGYLVGQYDEFGPEFVSIPAVDYTVTAGVPVYVLETAGMNVTYKDVVETVKDFDCGVNFADSYLKANDGLEVSLALVIVNPVTGEAYTIAEKSFSFTLPTATVTHLDTNNLDVEADFAMNFKANEVTEEQLKTFGNWKADYAVTISKDVTLNADGTKDGYLLGQYDEFGAEWVKLPATDLVVPANTTINVLESAGMNVTYKDVVETVKDFDCGINFSNEFLAANDGVTATVALRIYNPVTGEAFVIGEPVTRTWKMPTATVTELDLETLPVDLTFALNFKADDVNEEQLAMFGNWYADYELTVNKTATFNANGNADGFLSGQYDAWSKNWISVPFEDATLQANTPVRVMETAAALMGQSGLKLTYKDIVTSVKDFDCGLAFTPEFLVANPDLEVTLALKMYNPNNEDESYVIGRVYTFTPDTIPSIDKFVGKDVTLNHTIETIDGGKVSVTLADIFTAIGPVIMSQDVAVTVDGATVNKVASDWTMTTVDFTTPGTYTVEITDNYYCNTATATVTVVAPANVDKFVGKAIEVTHTLDTIESGKYTVDFADLFDTNGYAVKDITVTGGTYADGKVTVEGLGTITVTATDNFYCNVATATIIVNEPANVDKFTGKAVTKQHSIFTYENGVVTATLDELFTNNGYAVKEVTVGGDGTYADGVVSFAGTGTFTVTITDNFYCNTATATVVVNAPVAVDKWVGNTVTYTHTLDTIEGNTATFDFAELFTAIDGVPVKEITVTGATYADGKVTVEGIGTFTVTATDNFFCNIATATVTVNEPANVDKFIGWYRYGKHTLDTVKSGVYAFDFDRVFTVEDGAIVDWDNITVTGATYEDGKLLVEGFGEKTITVTDNFYCNVATATVKIEEPNPVHKFNPKFITVTHTLDTIESGEYTVDFEDLFDVSSDYPLGNIIVEGGVYKDGKITVTGLGTIIVTASDDFYAFPCPASITVKEPDSVDKFFGKDVVYTHTLDTIEDGVVTYTFEELFDVDDTYPIKAITVGGDGTFENGVFTFEGTGDFVVTVTDNFYCNEAEAYITIFEPENVDKWTGKTVSKKLAYGENTVTATLDELFTNNGYTTKTAVVGGDGTYANGVVTFTGAGTYTVTITDNFYCNTATATVTVANADPINKFTAKNPAVTHTLASIDAKATTVKLGDIFGGTNVVTGNITVTIAGKATTISAADWANATVTIPGTTGDVTVTITDNYYCNTATGKVTLKAPANQTKWTATNKTVNLTVATVGQNQTFNFADLFTAVNGAYIKTATVTVNNGGSYASNKITVPGTAGTYTVTVTDNFYCNPVTATITVKDAPKVDKFTGKNVTYTHTLDTIEANTVTYNFADLFTTNSAYPVKDITVTGGTYANGKITITGTGTKTITATDNYYCNTATATVTINAPAKVTKWTAKSGLAYETDAGVAVTKTLGELFSANGNKIKDANVSVTGATSFTQGATWDKGTVTFNGAGTYTVTITDGFYCTATSATVTITEVDPGPFRKFKATSNYIVYEREGEDTYASSTVTKTLGDIFTATGEASINSATVEVTAVTTERKAKATVILNTSDWTKSTVSFTGSGEVTFMITDNDNCIISKAIVAVTPDWVGNVDSGGYTSAGQVPHFSSSSVKHRTAADLVIAAGETKDINFADISRDAVYGLCFDLSGAANLRIQTSSGYYTDMVTTEGDWTDDFGWDRPLYIKVGDTVTVTNNGSTSVTIFARSMATDLFAGGNDMDFFPLVKSTIARPDPDTLPDPEIPEGPAESEPTAPSSMDYTTLVKYSSELVNVITPNKEVLYFQPSKNGSAVVTVGVPETGYYNISVMIGNSGGGNAIFDDFSVTTEGGESVTYSRTIAGGGFAYVNAPSTVYLVKGDRQLTFSANCASGNAIYLRGIKLIAQ